MVNDALKDAASQRWCGGIGTRRTQSVATIKASERPLTAMSAMLMIVSKVGPQGWLWAGIG